IWTPMYDATRASMSETQLKQHDAFVASLIPLGGQLGDASCHLAPVLVFLARQGSRLITGQTLMMGGGLLMRSCARDRIQSQAKLDFQRPGYSASLPLSGGANFTWSKTIHSIVLLQHLPLATMRMPRYSPRHP